MKKKESKYDGYGGCLLIMVIFILMIVIAFSK